MHRLDEKDLYCFTPIKFHTKMDIPSDLLVDADTFYAGLDRLQFLSCRCCARFTPFMCYLPPLNGIQKHMCGIPEDRMLFCPGCVPRPGELQQMFHFNAVQSALCCPELLEALKGFEYSNPFYRKFAQFPRILLTIETRVSGQLPAQTGKPLMEKLKAMQQMFPEVHWMENRRYTQIQEMAGALAAKAAVVQHFYEPGKHKLTMDSPPDSPVEVKKSKPAMEIDWVPVPSSSLPFNETLPPYVAVEPCYKLKVLSSKSSFSCDICLFTEKNAIRYGEFIEKKTKSYTLRCHYFCLLSGTHVTQKGTDSSGILGFLLRDLKDSFKKYRQNVCSFCGELSAAVLCSEPGCTTKFHFICGYKNGCLTQFKDTFPSYCSEHLPVRNQYLHHENEFCIICKEDMGPYGDTSSFCSECEPEQEGGDMEYAWSHRACMQRNAFESGYYFKCPNCYEKEDFLVFARERGIFVPLRDATWELQEGAYKDIHKCECTAPKCLYLPEKGVKMVDADEGRDFVGCKACGGCTMHMRCANVTDRAEYFCDECKDESLIKLF